MVKNEDVTMLTSSMLKEHNYDYDKIAKLYPNIEFVQMGDENNKAPKENKEEKAQMTK